MPELEKKDLCCGCAACFNACPKNAIEMKADETGFLYPVIDNSLCIDCKKCETVCPSLNPLERKDAEPHAYVGKHKNDQIREESTSGGIFTAIAEFVIKQGGVVFGATMDNNFVVHHKYVQSIEELAAFRNSKYVQSEIRNTYRQCREFLRSGKQVCYSGTPCQIHGLLKYLGKEYDNLITVDILCRSVPSPLIFSKYMEMQRKKFPTVNKVVFRDKAWGYAYPTMALYEDAKCLYRAGSEEDLWLRSFVPGLCDRENCKNCVYQKWPRSSDITIWDCFVINKIERKFDDNHGTTSIMTWTRKGSCIIDSVRERADIKEVNPLTFYKKIEGKKERLEKKLMLNQKQMYTEVQQMMPEDFFEKYRPKTRKVYAKIIGKRILRKLGLIKIVRKVIG
ncbi:hydrogenase [Treponema sp. JC4]|uniref:Coenzyme F420 hydrogenase/dehydrogenase, beta subunit C-terminal domain n=1 Tax=Treponema sp. JC4 TaxID=1124982 RepID=UPI00025B0CB4|nr:Coenzyme F420 hydrogenase/dehydrogenase, beta subunit C-terminal domain [Treponema sp. JC4]EID84150.1 hydrogenase [Treponema sp. JC4]